jgi:hypothetical protein
MTGVTRTHLMPAALAVALVAFATGCEPPDRPPAFAPGLPETAVAYLVPDRVSTFRLEEGVTYRSVRSGKFPWTVHLLEVDVTRCDLGFRVVRAEEGEGRLPVTEMARRSEPGAIAAVNGDFFTPEDRPLGVEVSGGVLRGTRSRSVFAWRPGEIPWVGPVAWEDDGIRFGDWSLSRADPEPEVQVVAGFPPLLRNGLPVGDLELAERPDFAAARDPRTAVGLDAEHDVLWIVVVDGRREGGSEGMTLPELVALFRSLGVGDAINLDGGGSSVMVVRGGVVNRPSVLWGERPVVNALVLRRDAAYCRAH